MVTARDAVEVVGSAAAGAGAGAIAYRAWRNVSERTIMDGKPTTLQRVEAARLSADASTFQFKSGGDGRGVTDRLSGVTKWNPAAAGKVMVYEFADGRQVIADGHQRLGLAQRLMSEGHEPIKMDAIVLRQKDGWQPRDVRAYAAIKNMHESSGHSLDMARVMRERPDLVTGSLPISDAKIREAKSLARLSEPAFNMVASGTVKPDVAAAVGDAVKDSSRHLDYLNEMTKAKVASGQHARLYVQQAMAAPSLTETTGSLFGEETTTRSLLKERAQVLDKALTALKQDKRIFGLLEREAGMIEAVGNRLSHAANAERATGAGRLAEMVEKLSTTRGPISEMLDRAAAAIAKGEAPAKAARAFVKDVGDTMKRGGISALTGNVPGRMQAMADDGTGAPKAKPVNPRRVEVNFGGDISGYVVDTESRTAKQIKRNRSTGGTFAQSVTNPKMLAKVLAKADEQVGKTASPPSAAAATARPVSPAVSRNIDRLEMLGWQGFRDAAKALNIDPSGSTPEIRARIEAAAHQDWMGRLQQVTDQFEARAKAGHHAAIGDLMEKAGVPEGKRAEVTAAAIADFERQSAAAQKVMTKGRPGWSDEARAASAESRRADAAKPAPRGMDGLTRAERAGRDAKPAVASAPIPTTGTTMERFRAAYEATLAEQVRINPSKYNYPMDRVPDIARRMTEHLANGTGDHQSPTVRAVAKAMGIEPTVSGLKAALNDMPAPVKAKVEGLSPQQMAAVKRAITSGASVNKDALAKATNAQLAALDDVALAARRGQTGGGGDWGKINGIEAWRSQIKDFARQTSQAAVDASMERQNPGWSDAAREASAKERGVALPGQAKAPTDRVADLAAKQGISMEEAARRVKAMDVFKDVPEQMARIAEAGKKQDARSRAAIKGAETRKANKAKAGGLAAAAQSAGVRDPNADMAKMFGPNLKPTAPTDQAAKSARADEFARRNFGKGETKPKRSKGSKALAMLGPVAIAGAAAVAFDSTRSQAQAAGDSAAAANTKATGAAVAAGGTVAAVGWGIAKGVQLAAKGAAVVAPRAAALMVPGAGMLLGGLAAYGFGQAAYQGYKDGGVKGAAKGVADFATMGAVSHFGARLTPAGATQFETANAAYMAMKPKAATTDQDSARKPGWGPESRIEAARARGAALLPYGGNPENAPGYIPPVTLPDAPKPKK